MSKVTEKSETLTIIYDVANGEKLSESRVVTRDARVKRVKAHFPQGEDGDLHVRIYGRTANGSMINLVNVLGDRNYLSGNNYTFDQDADVFIEKDSEIFVDAENHDTNGNVYPAMAEILLEYQ